MPLKETKLQPQEFRNLAYHAPTESVDRSPWKKQQQQQQRSKTFVICSNGSSYPFKTTVRRATVQNHFDPSPLATNLSKKK